MIHLRRQQRPRSVRGRVTTVLVFVLAGLLITIAAIAARGTDLRSDRQLSVRELITEMGATNTGLQQEIAALRAEVDELSGQDLGFGGLQRELDEVSLDASVSPVAGPALRVTLMDAPPEVKPAGASDDDLVVHQQDIQAVVNALWDGGAEAMTIQGQRVISTTGIKCVGNTVVLHGVPYAPPYVIEAIGDVERLEAGIDAAPAVQIYQQYVEAYGLGYSQERVGDVEMPGFVGSLDLSHARAGTG
ncbi:MAG: DUF881 domain-containing protein [Propionibacterium sp.]|nr:DUF881 domain-containing protein [Propionibacterium sp.]